MPRRRNLEDVELKFDDCADCAHVCRRICDDCDAGEYFEEAEMDGLDDLIVR